MTMAFYPIPFGHVEVRVDRRPQRPADYAREVARQQARRAPGEHDRYGG
jgi:hypothetical protein